MAQHQARFNSENISTQTYDNDGAKVRCYQEVKEVAETTSIAELRAYVLGDPANRLHLLQGRIASRACIAESKTVPNQQLPGVAVKRQRKIKYEKV